MAVTGIGGLFLIARNPEALTAWYSTHLGVGGGDWGLGNQQTGPTVFAPFPADSDYFSLEKQWMLNLRVERQPGVGPARRRSFRAHPRPRGQSGRVVGTRNT